MRMSITDELRNWAEGNALCAGMSLRTARDQAIAIADRIDAELVERYVALPLDADGVLISVGDRMVGPHLEPSYVVGVGVGVFFVYDGEAMYHGYDAKCYRHHHAPTVEDVLREFALKVAGEECMTMRTGVVDEYASKLREVLGE